MATAHRTPHFTESEVHDVLRNERRRNLLKILQVQQETLPLREISEQVAAIETGEAPPPRNIRESVYNSLHQTHLPKLDEMEIVTYERNRKLISLGERSDQVRLYMEPVPEYGITWATYYLTTGLLALIVIGLSAAGTPVFATFSVLVWTLIFFGLYILSALYQLWTLLNRREMVDFAG